MERVFRLRRLLEPLANVSHAVMRPRCELPYRQVPAILPGQRLKQNRFQLHRDRRVELTRRPRVLADDLLKQRLPLIARHSRLDSEQLVEGSAERINVATRPDQSRLTKGLLRTHVAQRAEQ